MQLALTKTPTKMLSPVLWVQKNGTQGNKVYLGMVRWVAWKRNGLFSASEGVLFGVDGEN